MKTKVITVLSAVIIAAGLIGGVAFAANANTGTQTPDAARYMQTGDYEKMNEFMNNLSEEDFKNMIELMKENGFASMAQMMESIGREGMIQMHNSTSSMHGEGTDMNGMHTGGSGMMGGFTSGG